MNTHTPTDEVGAVPNASAQQLRDSDHKVAPLGPNQPRAPFRSALKLTRKQEDAFVQWLRLQHDAMDQQLGRSATAHDSREGQVFEQNRSGEGRVSDLADTFFGKRLIYESTYENRMGWRKHVLGGVFAEPNGNLTLATARRITTQRIARFTRFFFEVDPWFACKPVGATDQKFARQLLKATNVKLADSGSTSEFRQAVAAACITGEGILHTQRVVDDDYYVEEIECLLDTRGLPIVAGDGDYITRQDKWIMQNNTMTLNADGTAAPDPSELLARDPTTSRKSGRITTPAGTFVPSQYAMHPVERQAVHYKGARTSLIYYRDFMCPLDARDIQTAPCIIHLETITVSEIAQRYAANPQPGTVRQAIDLLKTSRGAGDTGENRSAANEPRAALNETNEGYEPVNDVINAGHFYCRADPSGNGITSDIYCLMDMDTWTPIYYHYTAAVSPTRRRPYRVVRSRPISGRWFGQGEMEIFGHLSDLIDRFLNRAILVQSKSGRIVGWKPERTKEGQKKPNLQLDWGMTITPEGDWTLDDCVQVIYMQDTKSGELKNTLEMFLQAATNESGTASANDASAAGLDTQETATGINSLNNAGNELTSLPVAVLREGLTLALDDFVVTTLRFIDPKEVFELMEGDQAEQFQLNQSGLGTMRVDVTIMLTTFYGDQRATQTGNALTIFERWRQLCLADPQGANDGSMLYVDALQGQGMERAPDFIRPPDPIALPPTQPSQP